MEDGKSGTSVPPFLLLSIPVHVHFSQYSPPTPAPKNLFAVVRLLLATSSGPISNNEILPLAITGPQCTFKLELPCTAMPAPETIASPVLRGGAPSTGGNTSTFCCTTRRFNTPALLVCASASIIRD